MTAGGRKSGGKTKEDDPRQGRWFCFMEKPLPGESCFLGKADERARDRHMDRHFDARYLCSRRSCGKLMTRKDVGDKHTRETGHRIIVIDETPYWQQHANKHLLKRPRDEDAIWDPVSKVGDPNPLLTAMPWIPGLPEVQTLPQDAE